MNVIPGRSRTPSTWLAACAAALAACAPAGAQPDQPRAPASPPAAGPLSGPGLIVQTSRRGAAHMALRRAAAEGSQRDLPHARLLDAIEHAAGGTRIWALLDPAMFTPDEHAASLQSEALPLERVVGPDRLEPTREAVRDYRAALLASEADGERWAQVSQLELTGRASVVLGALCGPEGLLEPTLAALGIDIGRGVARLELVPLAPPPGAMTYRTPDGPLSIVGVRGLDEATLLEVCLHEAIHAFDALPAPEPAPDALTRLRRALTDAGLDPRDPRFRDAWHTLFFVHAAEMVRRDGRPAYVDYAERSGVYERTGPAARLARREWPRVLDGEVTTDAFIAALARAALAGD
jgi:hypothetical protein